MRALRAGGALTREAAELIPTVYVVRLQSISKGLSRRFSGYFERHTPNAGRVPLLPFLYVDRIHLD